MRKIIAAINMSIDGYCNHDTMLPDEELHFYYADLLRNADLILDGRITYDLMKDFWPEIARNPLGEKAIDEFAVVMDRVPKYVYSRTMAGVTWDTAELRRTLDLDELRALKQQPGKDIYVGSRSLIVALANAGLIDEFQLAVHSVLTAGGLPLFHGLRERTVLRLIKTATMASGTVVLHYVPADRTAQV